MSILAVTRAVTRAGRGLAWVFIVPVILAVLWITDDSMPWHGRSAASRMLELDIAIVVFLLLLWFFVLGRIPNARLVRNVRAQSYGAVAVFGVDVTILATEARTGKRARRATAANVIVVKPVGVELWAGFGDSARPVQSLMWQDVATVCVGNSPSTVIVQPEDRATTIELRLYSNRYFGWPLVVGKGKARLVDQFEELRLARVA